mgnify:CR=1 FL=1
MTSRTCCSRDSHRDAALTTANNQLFQCENARSSSLSFRFVDQDHTQREKDKERNGRLSVFLKPIIAL